jgi:hypothetical protein
MNATSLSADPDKDRIKLPPVTAKLRRITSSPDRIERCAAVLFALLALGALVMAVGLGIWQGTQPGAGLFPALVSVLVLLLAMLWLIQGARMPQDDMLVRAEEFALEGSGLTPEDLPVEEPSSTSPKVLAFVVLWALVPILLFTIVGFTISITLYVGGLLLLVGRTSRLWTLPLTFAIAVAVAIGAHSVGIYLPEPINYFVWLGL